MSDFSTPFAKDGPRRDPTAEERTGGFPSGPASLELFNGLLYRLEEEFRAILEAGAAPADELTYDSLKTAVENIVAGASGDPRLATLVNINDLLEYTPIYPTIGGGSRDVVDNAIVLSHTTSRSGINVVYPAFEVILGGVRRYSVNRGNVDIVDDGTYHLRWNRTDGVTLKSLGDTEYNSGGLAATDQSFDTGKSDVLLAEIIKDGASVTTTGLRNVANHSEQVVFNISDPTITDVFMIDGASYKNIFEIDIALNFARRPITLLNVTYANMKDIYDGTNYMGLAYLNGTTMSTIATVDSETVTRNSFKAYQSHHGSTLLGGYVNARL